MHVLSMNHALAGEIWLPCLVYVNQGPFLVLGSVPETTLLLRSQIQRPLILAITVGEKWSTLGVRKIQEKRQQQGLIVQLLNLTFVCLFKRITFTFIEKGIINRFNFLKGNLAIYGKPSKYDKFGKVYVCVEIRRKYSKMFMWLSLAAKFIGAFHFLLNIFQIWFNKPNFMCFNMKNMK